MSFTLQTLTEGIRDRHVGQQNKRLVEKWSRTGLLRGMDDVNRENMATMLENQAAQVLRESNTMNAGNVGGFSNIAFPIVRRVFGGLIANELVSIQPMSLPSGLLFYLDYTYGSAEGPHGTTESIYGGPAGKAIQGGADGLGGQYDLAGSGFSREHKSVTVAFGDVDETAKFDPTNATHLKLVDYDSAIIDAAATSAFQFVLLDATKLVGSDLSLIKTATAVMDDDGTAQSVVIAATQKLQGGTSHNVRKVNKVGTGSTLSTFKAGGLNSSGVQDQALFLIQIHASAPETAALTIDNGNVDGIIVVHVEADGAEGIANSVGGVDVDPAMEFLQNHTSATDPSAIPEIDIKIESIPVTAQTRKLRARWSPELAQDLNAYHSMDAEVELTQILSEQIALEIDREILGDLLNGAQGANFFWSRSPGKFVNKRTGAAVERASTLQPGPAFTGTVREWYETLTETVIDVANEIHRKTLRGSANFIVVSPDVATILEASVLYRPSYSLDGDGQVGAPFTMGAEKIGSLSNRFTVYKDPYFPRNKILVGYKGGSYLETGFVYAPYVPLIVTPTIFQPEDFTPRKGVMTRYGKKMVRADFYGTVTCLDMNII
jgi:hypothetical protein